MMTTLHADGRIGIPDEIRQADRLSAGDSFELERLTSGHYLLTRQPTPNPSCTVVLSEDGLPAIRVATGLITTSLVQSIESRTP